mmetsp:Transcript_71583/g.202261  ORF Transcript_71583/g.202261 Transcript_71583/m.202261 type:complete len:311 (+) Transcript_71583:653-1585(+)
MELDLSARIDAVPYEPKLKCSQIILVPIGVLDRVKVTIERRHHALVHLAVFEYAPHRATHQRGHVRGCERRRWPGRSRRRSAPPPAPATATSGLCRTSTTLASTTPAASATPTATAVRTPATATAPRATTAGRPAAVAAPAVAARRHRRRSTARRWHRLPLSPCLGAFIGERAGKVERALGQSLVCLLVVYVRFLRGELVLHQFGAALQHVGCSGVVVRLVPQPHDENRAEQLGRRSEARMSAERLLYHRCPRGHTERPPVPRSEQVTPLALLELVLRCRLTRLLVHVDIVSERVRQPRHRRARRCGVCV